LQTSALPKNLLASITRLFKANKKTLSLTLFVARVLTYHAHHTAAADYFTFVTDFFN